MCSLLLFYYYCVKQATHSARDRIIIKDNTNSKFELPITNHRNGLYYVSVSFIKSDAQIPSSFNMAQINDTLAAHERHLFDCPETVHKTTASNEFINMPCVSSSPINCSTRLTCKITKSQPASSKVKKSKHVTMQLSLAPTTIKRVKLIMIMLSLPIPVLPSKEIKTFDPFSENSKDSKSNYMQFCINSLWSLPRHDATCLPGILSHLDFLLCSIANIRGFTSALDALCPSTPCPWDFPTRSNRSPISIVLWLIRIINNQGKTAHSFRVDENGALARSSEFLKIIFELGVTIETIGGRESSSNCKVELPMRDNHKHTRITLTMPGLPVTLWCFA